MSYIDVVYEAARVEWMEEGKKVSIQKLYELLKRTPPEYSWMRKQIESTIKQIQDARPSDTLRTGGGDEQD